MRGLEGLRRQWHPLWVQPLQPLMEQQPVLGFWHFIAWARKRREWWPSVFSFFPLFLLLLLLLLLDYSDSHPVWLPKAWQPHRVRQKSLECQASDGGNWHKPVFSGRQCHKRNSIQVGGNKSKFRSQLWVRCGEGFIVWKVGGEDLNLGDGVN